MNVLRFVKLKVFFDVASIRIRRGLTSVQSIVVLNFFITVVFVAIEPVFGSRPFNFL
jgi:hypothetical protein